MDALLLAFVGCLLTEIGGKSQWLVLALANRYQRDGAILTGIAIAAIANAGISALAGAWIGPMLGTDARTLFLALAFLFVAVELAWPVKAPDPLDCWPTGAFVTSLLGLFILSFGDGAQFLVLGITTRTGDPVLAAMGGVAGLLAAWVPVVLLRETVFAAWPVRAIRWTAAVCAMLAGAIMGLKALHLL